MLKRKPQSNGPETPNPDEFVSQAKIQTKPEPAAAVKEPINEKKKQIVSFSLSASEMNWIETCLNEINKMTQKKITRTDIISAGLIVLRQKNPSEVFEIIKNM